MNKVISSRDELLERLREQTEALRAQGICHVFLFGSFARDEAGASSDVDLAIELDRDCKLGLVALAGLGRRLGELVDRRVDLVTLPARRADLRAEIAREGIRVF